MNREQIIAQLRSRGISFDENASTETLRSLLPQETGNTPSAPAAPAAGQRQESQPPAQSQRSEDPPRQPITTGREERPAPNAGEETRRALEAERRRTAEIENIAERARANGARIDHRAAIRDGVEVTDFQRQAFDAIVEAQSNFRPGLADSFSRGDRRDLARFDLGLAIRSLVENRQLDGVEREVIDEGRREARAAGIGSGGGITLPSFFVRDMTATGGSGGDQGGMTVATQKAGLLDDFFNASIMRQLGATVLTGLTSNIDIPRLVAGTAAAKKAENAAADEVSPTTAQLQLSPNRLPAFIDLSDQLLMQSSSAIESMIRSHLTAQMLATQEAAFFHGGGTSEANGIAGTSGIGSVAGGTDGAAPTYAHLVSLQEKVDAQNALGGSLAYASNGQIKAKLMLTPKQSSGVEGNFILGDREDSPLLGYRAMFTNAISRTLTKGTADSVASAIFFGNFSDYVIGYWGGLNLELVRDSAGAKTGLHTLVANTYYDGGVRRPKSFAAMLDALGA